MKIYKKNFVNEITDEADAAVHAERYLLVDHILTNKGIKTPKILKKEKTSVVLGYLDLDHQNVLPNFDEFHSATDTYYRKFTIEKAEGRLHFVKDHKLRTVALEAFEYVLKNEPFVFLHMDAVYKNYFANGNQTVWIDFQDAMMGPKSYDEIHYFVNCFEKTEFDIKKFNTYQQKSAIYNSIRQYGIFSTIPRFKEQYLHVAKYNVNKILKGLEYDLEIT